MIYVLLEISNSERSEGKIVGFKRNGTNGIRSRRSIDPISVSESGFRLIESGLLYGPVRLSNYFVLGSSFVTLKFSSSALGFPPRTFVFNIDRNNSLSSFKKFCEI